MNRVSPYTKQRMSFIRIALFGSLMLIAGSAAAQSHVTVGGHVFGGGKNASVGRGTTVLIDQAGAVVSGDVYGGGALAKVDTAISALNPDPVPATAIDSTLVTILNGSIKGNVYGGGLGQADDPGEEGDQSIAADVYGGVHVYIGNSARGNATLGNTEGLNVTGGNVFGGNNVNGSPKKNVKVDIWQTAHTEANEVDHNNVFTTFDNFKANVSHAMTAFAIQAVYGGGNEANYVPTVSESCSTSVYIHNCDNTVKMVYGGGRAADVGEVVSEDNTIKADVHVTVEGGRIDTLFGGGDGHTKDALGNYRAADIYGNAISAINGGYFTAAFAGSNTAGDIIGGTKQLTVSKTGPCSSGDEYIISLFGGSNEAATHGNVELTVGCGVDYIDELYGGSNKAEIIDGNVTLNVYGGNYTNVFGGSKGVADNPETDLVDESVPANITGNVTLNLYGGSMSNAFGGSNQNGNIDGQITVNVLNHEVTGCGLSVINNIYGAGNVTPYHPTSLSEGVLSPVVNVIHVGSSGSIGGNIYGGAKGSTATVTANPIVNFGYDATTMYELTGVDYPDESIDRDDYRAVATGNVYGGGDAAATVGNTAVFMYKSNSQAATVFGGGNEAGVSGATSITISDGTVTAGIYGGCNTSGIVSGDITVTMNGGAVGASGVGNEASVFGGGYGNSTATQGDVTVTVDGASAVVWGDVYGGSALGNVNNESTDVTTVNILDGEVKGDVFGGALGNATYAAAVNGGVIVNIGQDNGDGTYSGSATIGGNVYGCNNTNGSPQQDVTVNIYATAHTAGVNEVGDAGYALANVFGGGKNADFTVSGKRARVNVYSCDNTINRVFGGGDAAAVTGTAVMIQGGRINNVFGGGNGETTAANVGTLGINLDMHGGRIGTLVSASNTSGTIGGPINVTVDNESGCDEVVTDFFGGSNMVDIATDVTTTIECGAGTFTNVYGGSNQANITGDVVLNIKGGTMDNVYGGSKGVTDNPATPLVNEAVAANIDGNVTLNLYGGTINDDAFGGSNQNGAISGNITVNVLDHEGTCALDVNNIYGAGNVTPYTPTNPSATSPTINVMHIKQAAGIRGNVFGGGKGATAIVTAQPRVNIGYDASTMSSLTNVEYPAGIDRATEYVAKVTGSVYGGGDLASTNGSPIVKMEHPNSRVGNLFGGGNNVGISGNSTITINNGTVIDGVYGGCNVTGIVTGNSTITLLGGTVGSPSHNGNIFGGGLGQPTKVDGDVIITYGNTAGTATPTLYGNLYGGSALGAVNTKTANIDSHNMNTHETTTIDILSGSVNGDIFGGGLGQADDPEVDGDQSIAAIVHGKIQINVGSSTISDGDYTGNAVLQNATIYGCNNIKGTPQNDVYIDIYKTHRETSDEVGATSGATFAIGNVYGGGNRADYAPDYIYRREQAFIDGIANDSLRRPYVKKPHVYVHGCNNTISELYGGGNAAAVPGDSVVFDGGRYDLIFGGGNGTVVPANVGIGGVFLEGKGGFCGFIYEHCNRRGAIEGSVTFKNGSGNHEDCNEGVLKVHNHYCGGNEVDILGNFVYTFNCNTDETPNSDYNALYGGCRLGTTYGNITLIIEGGHFGTIFGGPRGAEGFAANVKKFPASREEMVNHPELYSDKMIEWMDKYGAGLYGTGGNVKIILRGGTIGDVFGGCDVNGNVEGRITIIVDSTGTCPLDIDNIFGGGNLASYSPDSAATVSNYAYPYIDLQNGHVNHNVFGGGKGSLVSVDNGKVTSNPKVHMHPDVANSKKFRVLGNIYGGGELGQVQGNTTVLIEKGTVKGSVYGAGLGNAADEDFGLVAKNTTVDMRDGLVEHNIYGGGEMSSVGTFTRTDHAVTGCTANTGKATVTILGGTVGPTSMPADFLSGYNGSDFVNDRIVGMVFGGSKGVAGNPESNPLYDYIAFANETDVTIGENSGHTGPFIKGSVYGGSQNGHVYNGGTYVKIYGGQIGCGAGQTTVYADEAFIATPATVTDDNKLAECPHWVYGRDDGNGVEYLPYDPYATISTADARPKGSDGHTYYGNVYGGGSGFYPFAERQWLRSAGQVYGSTKVEITGGHILTSVYGGNELTDVTGDSCVVIMTGGTIGVPRTLTQIGNHPVTCYLFGSGKGDERTHFNQWTNVQNTRVSVSGTARIYGSIFGGGEDGHVLRNTKVTLKDVVLGTTGTSYVDGNVFGGGRGFKGDALTAGNVGGDVLVDISGTSSTKVLGSVYGGGRLASVGYGLYPPDDPQYGVMRPDNQDDDGNSVPGFARGHIRINIHGSATIGNEISTDYSAEHSKGGNVFGSSMGRLTKLDGTYLLDLWQKLGTSKQTTVHIYENAKVRGNVYGGSELGSVAENTTVNIYGNAEIGHLTSGTHYHGDVYAGGYGISTKKSDLSTITEEGDLRNKVQQFSGRVYGSTEVNVYGNATLHGDVYGGGEMASVGTENVDASGNTLVNIGEYNGGDYRGNATIIGGEVYGCNNIAGTPLGNAVVNIYSTHRETNEEVDYDGASPAFALANVYGGGNEADYRPNGDPTTSTKHTSVHVYGCANTIEDLYGGGNAAYAYGVATTIDGGRFDRVFGGGNGEAEDTQADIGAGGTNTTINAGIIRQVFGGSNMRGTIYGPLFTTLTNSGSCTEDEHINEFYAGSNEATIVGDITTTVECSTPPVSVSNIYGGCNLANIYGSTTLNIHGGTFTNVYGGSKGVPGTAANINRYDADHYPTDHSELIGTGGTATLNIYGGTITNAFGGSDANGNIQGAINVTVDQTGDCALNLDYVYGGGNLATNDVVDHTITSPYVHLLNGTVNHDVFGGGLGNTSNANTGKTTANAKVEMTPDVAGGKNFLVKDNIYGGGSLASVEGTTSVTVTGGTVGQSSYYMGAAPSTDPSANPDANANYSAVSAYYNDNAPANTELGHVFGGGKGNTAYPALCTVNGTNVTIGTVDGEVSDLRIYGSVFGGAAKGHVTGNTAVTVHSGTVGTLGVSSWDGYVFGGGEGGGTGSGGTFAIYPTCGHVGGNTSVSIDGGRIKGSVYGGGRLALTGVDQTGDPSFREAVPNNTKYDSVSHGFATVSVGGNAVIGMGANDNEAITALASDYSVGDIFGSGRGDVDYYNSVLAGRVANTSVTVSGSPTVYGAVFGGGEMAGVGYWTDAAGHPFVPQTGTSHVNVSGGTFGTTYEYSNVYLASPGAWTVVTDGKLTHACTGNIVGGSQGDVDPDYPHWISMGRSRQTFVNISGGTIMGNVYGGAEQGVVMENTKVTVSGGTIGTRITNPNYADSVTTCQDIHDAWVEAHNTWASSDEVAAHNTWKDNHAVWVLKKISHDAWAADKAAHDAWLARKSAHEAWETAYAAWLDGDRAALDQPVEPPLPGDEPTVDVEPVAPGDEPVDPGEPIEPEEPECSVQEYLYSFGSVFGGGYGREQTDAHTNDSSAVATLIAGRVYGNTTVIISGGQIYENVYGGGNMASVGYVEKVAGSYALNDTTRHHNGVCNVTITGTAIIGPHDHTLMNGHVYGGGKGVGNDPTEYFKEYCNVNRTNLIVSGGHIYGSTFGGGADCHVLGSTSTTIQDDAYIGSDEYIEEYDGCVIGGGRNALNRNHTAGRVAGNVHVTVTGGRIQRSVLGGGALARTGVDVDGGVDAFVNNSGDYDSVHHGRTVVNVSGTSEVVNADLMETTYSRFKGTTTTEGVADGYVRLHHTTIGAPNGPILVDNDYTIGDIFGGGKGDTKDTTDIMAGRVMNTFVTVSGSPRIMADIYAGGEMSCIGWWDTNRYVGEWKKSDKNNNHDKYYTGTGYTHVTIEGMPRTGTPYEFSSANIHYGRPWTLIDSLGRLYHTCSGNVYGGGQGYVEEFATHRNNWVHMGRVRRTFVNVSGGRFMGNVFGGGSRGVVKEHCRVDISGGTFGTIIVEDTVIRDTTYTYTKDGGGKIVSRTVKEIKTTVHDREYAYGSAFGGGYGNHKVFWHYNDSSFVTTGGTRIQMQPMEQAGRVYGNTYLTISGGQFMGNVYGGGDMASTGYVERNASTGEFEFHTASKRHGGICNVTITGGEVGPLHDEEKQLNGHVYGGGKGIPFDPNDNFKKYCNVNETNLIVSGGHIYGSTFGGGADCHVLGNTNTTIHEGAYIGSNGDEKEYDGCVFGGGRNAENSNGTAGRVQGNAYITVDGGRIRRSILGGGALARTGVDVNGGVDAFVSAGVYDSTYHGSTYINVTGSTVVIDDIVEADGVDYEGHEVLIDGMSDEDKEKNKNFIYSLSASDKETYKDYLGTTEVRKVGDVYKIIVYKTAIGAYDGAVLVDNDYTIGDIFGGGKGDTKDTVDIMAGRVMNTHVFITGSPRIMADVYAGGEMSSVGWWDTNRFENNAWPTGTPNNNHDKYYTNTGYTKLVIQDDPYTGTPYEFSSANIRGGRAWTLIDEINRLYHTCSGNVYGGGQGYVEQDATHYMNWVHMGRVRETSVRVEGGRFMGNAFGGGSRGVVKGDCSVTITGGTFGTIIYDQPTGYNKTYYYYGSVFGGGYGNHKRFPHINDSSFVITTGEHTGDKVPMVPTEQAGRVYGNTTVNISGGHIMDCVYGGGDMASTGYVERDPATGDFMLGDASKRHGGICTVNITGTAIVGPLDYNGHNGYVYGAGRGIGSDANEYSKTFCNVNETRLTVALTEGGSADPTKGPDQWDVATMGGRIWGSLFGGGADCHVLGNVSTTLNSGVVGTDGTTSFDGNIFGGGRNYLHSNTTNGRVQGNIAVTVTRGTLRGTIFGGGRLAMAGIDVNGDFPTTGWTIADHGNVTITVSGTKTEETYHTSIGNPVTDSLLSTWESNGDIFGSGKGDTKIPYTMEDAGRVTNATINVSGSPRICGSVFGGGEMASLGYWNNTTYAFIDGTGIATINITDSPTIGSINEINSYHKAADPENPDTEHGENPGDWTIYDVGGNLIHTCTGNIYGGCQGDIDLSSPAWVHMGRSYSSNINITGTPTIMSNVSGGSEQGTVWGNTNVVINMSTGGTIGTTIANASLPNNGKMFGGVYGGGYGADEAADTAATYTDALGSHDVTNNYEGHRTNWRADYIAGRVFGDTQVDILGGTINGSVYGGGERAYVGEDENGGSYGNTLVNIGNAGQRGDASKGATILGDVFGANNYMGTPYGNTEVHIYSTAHTVANTAPTATYTKALTDPVAELTETDVEALPTTAESFAINAVYGGGNKAAHKPLASDGTTLVHIHYCEENSVRQVYGGGNGLGATKNASTKNNHIIIEGGRINVVFGGGNGASADGSSDKPYLDGSGNPTSTVTAVRNPGYNPGADVTGTAWTEIKGGLINDVFGGSNAKGVVSNTRLDIEPDGSCDMMVANTFGGGNEAFGGGGVITVGCGTKIGSFYGGSSNANLRGDIVLNVEGGTFENIFGGSRGTNERPANIDGNVTINISGGNIQNIFGGSDINGNITGSITVNVDLDPDYNCDDGLLIGTIYGGGNLAIYRPNLLGEAPNQTLPFSPEINIINDSCANGKTFGLRTVFGGGYGNGLAHDGHLRNPESSDSDTLTGYMKSNPVVNVGGIDLRWDKSEGPMGELVANEYRRNIASIRSNVYGGGEAAPVDGNPRVTLYSSRITSLDGSGNPVEATKNWDTTIVHGSVFGGGHGQTATVKGNTTVGVFGDATVVNGNVYGGGEAAITDGNTDVMVGYSVIAMPKVWIDEGGNVHIDCETPGVTIYYTTDGSVPNNRGNGTAYNGTPLTPSAGENVRAIAYKYGYPPSLPTYPMHTFAPVISISEGTVTLSMPAGGHSDAEIYYTIDGTDPTSSSTHYNNSPFAAPSSNVVKAIAVRPGYASSKVTKLTCATPVVEIDRSGTAKITCATAGATIRYTLGVDPADPVAWTTATTVANGGTVTVPSGQTIKVMADCGGYGPSEVAVNANSSAEVPNISVNADTRTVTITATRGTIHFTTDGSTPTSESATYSEPLENMAGKTIKAIAIVDENTSTVATLSPAATPTFNAVSYNNGDQVSLTSTSGATIYYTTDGTTPTTASTRYTGPFNALGGTHLKAYAVKNDMNVSAVTSVIDVPLCNLTAPTISVEGTSTTPNTVTITADAGATIYYTVDGTTPTAESNTYNSTITLNHGGTTTVKAIAIRAGCNNSDVTSRDVTITAVATPTFTTTATTRDVTISFDSEANLRYTNSPSVSPTATSARYTPQSPGVFTYNNPGSTLNVVAEKNGVLSEAVLITPVAKPTFEVDDATVTISGADGTTVYYSTDGGSIYNTYTEPFTVNTTTSVKAYAYKIGHNVSGINKEYVVVGGCVVANPYADEHGLNCDTPGATILWYYSSWQQYTESDWTIIQDYIEMGETVIIKATKEGCTDSEEVTLE